MKKTLSVFSFLILGTMTLFAQEKEEGPDKPFTISGYGEVYYIYDVNQPADHNRPFAYSHNRTNEININLAFIKANYTTETVRANFALGTGTYMNANYAGEQGVLKNIYEANIGLKISKRQDLWIDVGVIPSHIGFESATGKDNWTLTRSLAAENSPYFETGARLGYTSPNNKWYLAMLYLNGWQRIARVNNNNTPSFGTQITYKPSSRITLNYSTFGGSDEPDSVRKMRYFQNLYGILELSEHWGIALGTDYGLQQQQKGSYHYNPWLASTLIIRYLPSKKTSIAVRAEYYDDENGVIVSTDNPSGFKVFGLSLNADYLIRENVLGRLEVRNFTGENDIFTNKARIPSNKTIFISTALAISF